MCAGYHLTQHVMSPIRGNNTLDLILSDLPDPVVASALPPLGHSDMLSSQQISPRLYLSVNVPQQPGRCGVTTMLTGTDFVPTFVLLTGQLVRRPIP